MTFLKLGIRLKVFLRKAGFYVVVNYPALSGGASCFMDNTCITEM